MFGQTAPAAAAGAAKKTDKATAYYHFALGHLYSELSSGNRGDFLTKAIDNYKLAMKADPSATFLADELSDLYIQAGRLRDAVTEAEEAVKANPADIGSRRILGRIYTRLIGDSQQGKVDEGMLRRAIEQYQKISELQPKDVDSLLILGRLNKVAQNSMEAEKAYKKILEIEPENEDALTGLAVVYSDLGDTKQAADLLRKVTNKTPSVRTLMALAGQYEQLRDYALAAETLKKALDLAPTNKDIKNAYAQNLVFADRLDDALKVYQELATEDPKDARVHLRISQIYRQKRDFANATKAGQQALAIDPENLEVRYNTVALLEAEGKTKEAVDSLKQMLESTAKKGYSAGERSNRVALLRSLAALYRGSEQYNEAVDAYRQIVELDPASGAMSAAQIADTYRAGRNYAKASEEIRDALKKYPEDRLLRGVSASILAETGKTSDAVAELKTMLDGKNDRETYISLAQVYEKAKDYGEMAKAIDAAEKLSTSSEEKEAVTFMRGAMLEKMKKLDAAEAEFRKVLQLNPKNASALNYLGYMLADANVRLPEAVQLIKSAVELEPENGAYLDSLGWAYYRTGDLQQAEQYLERAISKLGGKDPTVHDHLGDVYFKRGKVKEAVAAWERSLQEWEQMPAADRDPVESAKVQKKLETAKVRLAKESGAPNGSKQQ